MSFVQERTLRQERQQKAEEAGRFLTEKVKDGRKMTEEERTQFRAMHADISAYDEQIEDFVTQRDAEQRLAKPLEVFNPQTKQNEPVPQDDSPDAEERAHNYNQAFEAWLRFGDQGITDEGRKLLSFGSADVAESRVAQANKYVKPNNAREHRVLQVGVPADGGTVNPDTFVRRLYDVRDTFGGFMQSGPNVFTTERGETMTFPNVNDTTQEAEIVAENAAVTEQDVQFGEIELGAYKYSSKLVKVSLEASQDIVFDITGILSTAFGKRFGRSRNKHFTIGAGTTEPFGCLTQATNSTKSTPAATVLATVDLLRLKHDVQPEFRQGPSVGWQFNDNTLLSLKELVDTTDRPLWKVSDRVGEPSTFDGDRYFINWDMPDIGTGLSSVMYGDYSAYNVRDVAGMRLFRLEEMFIQNGQIGFLAFMRFDGALGDHGDNPVKKLTHA